MVLGPSSNAGTPVKSRPSTGLKLAPISSSGRVSDLTPLLDILLVLVFLLMIRAKVFELGRSASQAEALKAAEQEIAGLTTALDRSAEKLRQLEAKLVDQEQAVRRRQRAKVERLMKLRNVDVERVRDFLGLSEEAVRRLLSSISDQSRAEVLDAAAASPKELLRKLQQLSQVKKHVAFWSVIVEEDGTLLLDFRRSTEAGPLQANRLSFAAVQGYDPNRLRSELQRALETSIGAPSRQMVFVELGFRRNARFDASTVAEDGVRAWVELLRRLYGREGKTFHMVDVGLAGPTKGVTRPPSTGPTTPNKGD